MACKWFTLFLILFTFACEPKPLKQNDRVVFIGDSITASGIWTDGFITIVNRTIQEKYPDLNVTVAGAGVAGDRSTDVLARIDRILTLAPTVTVLLVGINDVWGTLNGTGNSIPVYYGTMLKIVDRLDDSSRVILCTPTTIGEDHSGWDLLDEYSNWVRKIAVDNKIQLIDLRDVFAKQLKDNTKAFGVLTIDGVHPNIAGSRLIADKILEGLCVN